MKNDVLKDLARAKAMFQQRAVVSFIMGVDCPSGSRIGSTEVDVRSHAGSNPASTPANLTEDAKP